ncbi:ankyrin repeat domain-containing protein [Salmonella enterica]|uniref:ankyrin repeat domain-containing protein n=1 Tax=Salmonella enterica TaxID=28901 RepID=UPI003AB3B8F9|nr:ankyrin repeat domain-containing protein [Salmonella enterica]
MSNINVNPNEVFDKIFNDKDLMSRIIDNAMEKELNKQNLIKKLTDDTIKHVKERCFDGPEDWFSFNQLCSLPPNEVIEKIYEEKENNNEIEDDFYQKLNEEVRKERIKVINEIEDISLFINNDSGNNPLHKINDESLVDLLIEKGFDVNANNNRMCNSLEERLFDGYNNLIQLHQKEIEDEQKEVIIKLIDSGVDYSRVIKHLPDEIKEHIKMKEIKDEQKALSEIRNENNEPKRKPRI